MVDDEGHVVVEAGQGGRFLGCTASLDLEAEEGQELLDAVEVGGLLLGEKRPRIWVWTSERRRAVWEREMGT